MQSGEQPAEEEGRQPFGEQEDQHVQEGDRQPVEGDGQPDGDKAEQPELPVEFELSFSKEAGQNVTTDELLDSYKARIQELEKQLQEAQQRNARLCDALLDKIGQCQNSMLFVGFVSTFQNYECSEKGILNSLIC